MFMPFHVLGIWLRALLSIVLIAAGLGLLAYWYTHREQVVTEQVPVADTEAPPANTEPPDRVQTPRTEQRVRVVHWHFGANWETVSLLGGLALLLWSCGGGWLVSPHLWRRQDANPPPPVRGTPQRLQRPDGSALYVESFGPADGMPVILIHGWSLDSDEWCYTKAELGRTHRLIVWDLPGLGASDRPAAGECHLAQEQAEAGDDEAEAHEPQAGPDPGQEGALAGKAGAGVFARSLGSLVGGQERLSCRVRVGCTSRSGGSRRAVGRAAKPVHS